MTVMIALTWVSTYFDVNYRYVPTTPTFNLIQFRKKSHQHTGNVKSINHSKNIQKGPERCKGNMCCNLFVVCGWLVNTRQCKVVQTSFYVWNGIDWNGGGEWLERDKGDVPLSGQRETLSIEISILITS